MLSVKIPASKSFTYPVLIDSKLLSHPLTWLQGLKRDVSNFVIITDNHIKNDYGATLLNSLHSLKAKTLLLSCPAGERSKTNKMKYYLEEQMLQNKCDRESIILALGGGVIGDLAGFIAATYMRGISYIQIPTTLLAMVDSSIGGKTAINTKYGKNLIGAFWQPQMVIADVQCLKSLSKIQLINGFIEALKMFITNDAKSFDYAKCHIENILKRDEEVLKNLIYRAIKIKTDIIQNDVKEKNGQRLICNFGHTIGHALEILSNYKILHGHAVGFGILVEAKISQLMGLLDKESYERIQSFLSYIGIVGKKLRAFNSDELLQATLLDKKTKAGQAHYVLLKTIGQVYVNHHQFAHPVSNNIVKQAFLEVISTEVKK